MIPLLQCGILYRHNPNTIAKPICIRPPEEPRRSFFVYHFFTQPPSYSPHLSPQNSPSVPTNPFLTHIIPRSLHSRVCPHSVSLQLHNLRRHILAEGLIMLHKQDRGLVLLQHRLDLHSGDDVDVVHRLVPDVQVHGFADGTGEENLFLLACA